jgi:putative ABC transport system ATP-binding protein
MTRRSNHGLTVLSAAEPIVRRSDDGRSAKVMTRQCPDSPDTTRRSDARSLDRRTTAEASIFTVETMTLLQNPPTHRRTIAAASARGATKTYGNGDTEVLALDHVDVDFAAGQFTAIMGPSGSGKSTLMHCMAGLDRLSSGSVTVGDVDISNASEKQLTVLRRDRLGFIFQAFNLVPTLTAIENITLPMDLAGTRPDRAWVDRVISTVGLSHRLKHRPSELSGGQQQRVAVARALASRPQIVFADEPTGNLDSTTGAQILAFMRHAVRELGQTIVMVTHDAVAASYSDRVVFLADGRITDQLADPTPDAVLDHMRRLSN